MAIIVVSGQNVESSGSTSTTTAHFNNTIVGGNAIIVAVATASATQGATNVTDNASNTFVKQGTSYQGNGLTLELWACLNASSTGTQNQTVTGTTTSGLQISVIGQEISGLATSSAFDKQSSVTGTSTTSNTTPSVTTTQANEILLGIGGQNNTNRPYTAGTGYTMINQQGGSAGNSLEYDIVSSTGSYTASMTIDLAENWSLGLWTLADTSITSGDTVSVSDSTTTSESIKLLLSSNVATSDSTATSEKIDITRNNARDISVSDSTTTSESVTVGNIPTLQINVSDTTTTTENIYPLYGSNAVFHDACNSSATFTSVGSNTTFGGNNGMFGTLGASGSMHINFSGGNFVYEGARKTLTATSTVFQFYYRPDSAATLGTGNSIFGAYTDATFTNSSAPIRLDVTPSSGSFKFTLVDPSNSFASTAGSTTFALGTAVRITLYQTTAGWTVYLNNSTTPEITYTHTQTVTVSNVSFGTSFQNPTGSYSGIADIDEIWIGNEGTAPSTVAQKSFDAYQGYLQNHISADGQPYRGPVDGNNLSSVATIDTVSEGAAYLLRLAAQNNDQYSFNLSDNWVLQNLLRSVSTSGNTQNNPAPSNALNLMAFHYNSANTDGKGIGTIYDANWAGDAEADRMQALFWAHGRWGSSVLTVGTTQELVHPNYLQRAKNVESDLFNYAFSNSIATGYNYLLADQFQQGNSTVNIAPDYNNPGAYYLAKEYVSSHASFWTAAINGCYDIIQKTATTIFTGQLTQVGLNSDWVAFVVATATVSTTASSYGDFNYGFNAFRSAYRLYDAWVFYGDSGALTSLQEPKSFFTTQWGAHSEIFATFNHDGTNPAGFEATYFTYPAYWAIYANDAGNSTASAINSAKLSNLYYQEPYGSIISDAPSTAQYGYFGQSWDLVGYMQQNGLWTNFGGDEDISVSDSTSTSESVKLLDSDNINVSDATSTSEAIKFLVTDPISVSDSTSTSESISLRVVSSVVVSDSTSTTESVTVQIPTAGILVVNVSDNSTTSESVTLLESISISTSDVTTASENTRLLGTNFIAASDSTSTSESIKFIDIDNISVSDLVTTSENIRLIATDSVNVSDSTSTSESVSVQINSGGAIVSDSVVTSETIKLLVTYFITVSDTTVISEQVFAGGTNFSVSDSIITSESVSLVIYLPVSIGKVTTVPFVLPLAKTVPFILPKVITPPFSTVKAITVPFATSKPVTVPLSLTK